jgi:hypothetical protein
MATYDVTKVRKETVRTNNGTHEHIIGVLPTSGLYYSNAEVVSSIQSGNVWQTYVPGEPRARIKELRFCPQPGCLHSPYLTTHPDHSTKNNLENLPRG